jgi:hypothetical protein
MSDDLELDRTLEDWARSGVPLEDAEDAASRRERVVPRIAENIRRRAEQNARRRRMRRWAIGLSAAAAIALGIGGFAVRPRIGPMAAGSDMRSLAVGDEVRTERDGKTAVRVGAATLELSASSRVTLQADSAAGQIVRLDAGEIGVSVPKLQPPATFVVQTSDARVVVHGTRRVRCSAERRARARACA